MRRTLILLVIPLVVALIPQATYAAGMVGCAAANVAVGAGAAAASAANSVPVHDADNLAKNSVTASKTTTLTAKECIMDGLVVAIREALIASMTDSIVEWINNGFEGGPAFVTDLNGFMGQIADNISLDFLHGTDLGFVCSPFQLQIRLALALNYSQRFSDEVYCSLADASENVQGFLEGNFSQGGWKAWFRLANGVQNNPYGAYLLASGELSARITSAQGEQTTLLNFGSGFFSKKKCDQWSTPGSSDLYVQGGGYYATVPGAAPASSATQPTCLHYSIVTPGTQINAQLAEALGTGLDQLELADEIDEVINALLGQLMQKALTSIGGISGLSQRSPSYNPRSGGGYQGSYLEQIVDETNNGSTDAGREVLLGDVTAAVSFENDYQGEAADLLSLLTEEHTLLTNRHQCYVSSSGSGALAAAGQASTTLTTLVVPTILTYQRELTIATGNEEYLTDLEFWIADANSVSELNAAADAFDEFVRSGELHILADLVTLTADTDTVTARLAAEHAATGDACLTQYP